MERLLHQLQLDSATEDAADTTHNSNQKVVKVPSRLGMIALGITGTLATGLVVGTLPFLTPALRKICLPFVPATESQIQNILKLCKGQTSRLVDLGSGDGRVVLAAARAGYEAVGYELNYFLVLYSKIRARFEGLHTKASFSRVNLWKADLKDFDTVVIFGVDVMMPKLQEKLASEMKEGAKVLACRFPLPDWQHDVAIQAGIDTVWRYKKH